MAIERMPITPEVITWARERLGYTLDALIAKRNEFKRIAEWESGESRPTYRQLEMLAKELWLPVAVFFFPEPPESPKIEETFRTLGSEQFDEIPPSIRKLLYKARAFQVGLSELSDQRNLAQNHIIRDLSLHVDQELSSAARKVREYIGIPLEHQFQWNDDDEALKTWRSALFRVGVTVFKDAFKTDSFSGFSLYDDEFPIIYVNNSNAKARQIFTLFHELAHLLFHTSGVDRDAAFRHPFPADKIRIEKTCNCLASAVLVPEESLSEELSACAADRSLAENLARKFCVSREMIFRRFLDRGLISDLEFKEAIELWGSERPRDTSAVGGNYYYTKIAYLGEEYITLAFARFYQGHIDEEELADYLAIKPKHIDGLEDALFEVTR